VAYIVPDTARHEVKFVTQEINYYHIKNWLKSHNGAFRTSYPDRQINNVYFDSFDYTTICENIWGSSSRSKVRYRWYGDSITPAEGTLEIKNRRNSYGWKNSFKVSDAPYKEGANWKLIQRLLATQLPSEARIWLDTHPLPILINRYHREYFESWDRLIRVTIDRNQSVWEQRYNQKPNFTQRAQMANTIVIEIKCSRRDREYANKIIQGIPIRVSRHSKYVVGVQTLAGV